ncbi:hypothetical protein KAOT1_06792 [Kordia algicida OT-1]|uniref:Uncharacterized protein n=1 Tax=Kordia algicida OT-1 TaxID=391587 RepID=A9E5E2_9FLAO|nr:hypothetical protein KAOT1_06792 [Kordia algicida OT-1]
MFLGLLPILTDRSIDGNLKSQFKTKSKELINLKNHEKFKN